MIATKQTFVELQIFSLKLQVFALPRQTFSEAALIANYGSEYVMAATTYHISHVANKTLQGLISSWPALTFQFDFYPAVGSLHCLP